MLEEAGSVPRIGGLARAARLPKPSRKEPGRFLRDTQVFGKERRRDTAARVRKEEYRAEPLVERDMGTPENRAGPDREILSAGQATEVSFALPCLNPVVGVAARAGGTPLPSQRFDMRARLTFIRKEPE